MGVLSKLAGSGKWSSLVQLLIMAATAYYLHSQGLDDAILPVLIGQGVSGAAPSPALAIKKP